MSTANPRIALRMHHRYLASSNRRIEVIALRRPDVTVRQTDYRGFIVDERVLTKAFPWTVRTDRLQVLLVLDGHVLWDDLELGPMDVALLRPEQQALARFANARFVDVEWRSTSEAARDTAVEPSRLGSLSAAVAASLVDALSAHERPQREVFELAFESLRAVGAPFGSLDAASLVGGPSERDERIGRAVEAQLGSLATKADTSSLGELADLSPRQVNRVLGDFVERYGLNSGNWRDMRNRLRLQVAATLLSDAGLSIADVAAEVGYGSAPALARAFALAGFPTPTEVRRLLRERLGSGVPGSSYPEP